MLVRITPAFVFAQMLAEKQNRQPPHKTTMAVALACISSLVWWAPAVSGRLNWNSLYFVELHKFSRYTHKERFPLVEEFFEVRNRNYSYFMKREPTVWTMYSMLCTPPPTHTSYIPPCFTPLFHWLNKWLHIGVFFIWEEPVEQHHSSLTILVHTRNATGRKIHPVGVTQN